MANVTQVTNTSTQSVLTALASNGVLFGVFFALFLLFRLKFLRIYQPKSAYDLINDEKKPDPLPSGLWQWFLPLLKKSDNFVIRQAGLDGYFFLRYIAIVAAISFFYMLLFFPILLPVNGVDGKDSEGLNQYTFSNVGDKQRYYAHAILAWVFYLGVIYVIYKELTYYASMRQAVLSSPRYGQKLSSRTVLFQTVPDQYLDEGEFAKLFEDVKKVWIARGASNIQDKVTDRDKLAYRLEAAEVKLLKTAMKLKAKKEKKGENTPQDISLLVPEKKRPTHRLKFLIGKKVDTINYAKEQLPILNKEVEELQKNHLKGKPMNSVFVEFGSQYSAQMAYQSVAHHTPLHLSPRYIGLEPKDIFWINMRLFWWERLVRYTGSFAAIVALVIFWSIPVAFVGMISNITYLTNKLPGLNFIYNLPPQLLGLITSMLPTVALAVLMSVLPVFIRFMAKVSGSPSSQHVEYFTQQAYFAFQVIQVFLVTTIASSATSTVTQIIEEPTSAMYLLSENLPLASNFYLSYIILQGLTVSSGALLQIVPLVIFYVLGSLLDGTPRKKWRRFSTLSSCSWGTVFPVFTNLAVITFTYAIISPFILLFATVGFFLLYVAYLYNLTYAFQESPDARGMHYPRALFQTMVGCYLGEICLLGLFAVSKAWGPLVLDAILLGITVFVHVNLNGAFDELLKVVPVDTMKPLDGISDTPSYHHNFGAMPHSDSAMYDKSIMSSIKHEDSFLAPPNAFEMGDLNRFSLDRSRHGTSVPLLADGDTSLIPPAPLWKRFFQPHIYASYKVAKTRMPDIYQFKDPMDPTDPAVIEHAYDFPAVSAKCPVIWIPRDPFGWSTQEIEHLKGIIEMSDENAEFNDAGKIVWTGAPPTYEETTTQGLGDKDDKP
jgi:hypothetical protein